MTELCELRCVAGAFILFALIEAFMWIRAEFQLIDARRNLYKYRRRIAQCMCKDFSVSPAEMDSILDMLSKPAIVIPELKEILDKDPEQPY